MIEWFEPETRAHYAVLVQPDKSTSMILGTGPRAWLTTYPHDESELVMVTRLSWLVWGMYVYE